MEILQQAKFSHSDASPVAMWAAAQPWIFVRRFGQSRKEAESFVSSFEDVSITQRLRMMGDDVRLFRCACLDFDAQVASH